MTKLSKRAEKAVSVLQDGGCFRYALETNNYTRREQFHMRLLDAKRQRVPGVGFQAQLELEKAGLLTTRPCPKSSTWPTEYVLRA